MVSDKCVVKRPSRAVVPGRCYATKLPSPPELIDWDASPASPSVHIQTQSDYAVKERPFTRFETAMVWTDPERWNMACAVDVRRQIENSPRSPYQCLA